jgi:hypothetical protein
LSLILSYPILSILNSQPLKVGFDSSLSLEFHGSKVTTDAGLIPCRELEGVLGLFDSVAEDLSEVRTGRNIQLGRETFFTRQFIAVWPASKMLMMRPGNASHLREECRQCKLNGTF